MKTQRSSNGYPLSALFLAVAAAAVLVSLAVPGLRSWNPGTWGPVERWSTALACVGAVLGCILGLYHYRRLRGAGWGGLTGFLLGVCLGPAAISKDFDRVALSCLAGSVVLVSIGVFCRFSARRTQV